MAGEIFGCCGWHTECRSLGHCVREEQHGEDICSMRKWIGKDVKEAQPAPVDKPKSVAKPVVKPVQRRLF